MYWLKREKFEAFLILYVDDILLAGNDESELLKITESLTKIFEVSNLGEPTKYLGIEIKRNREKREMTLNQREYSVNMLKRFNMWSAKPQDIPMATKSVSNKQKEIWDKRELEKPMENEQSNTIKRENEPKLFPYREAIGSLLYLGNTTRPDILYAVNALSRRQTNPTRFDWEEVKRVFRYVRGTLDLGLKYFGKTNEIIAFTDASFGDCESTRKSTSGIIVKLFNDPVFWSSKRQGTVSNSTCEAEYIALNSGLIECIGVSATAQRAIGLSLEPYKIFGDNTASLKCASKPGAPKLKHLTDIKLHHILDHVVRNKANIHWIGSEEQEADILTKPLPKRAFIHLREKLLREIKQ